MKKIYVFFLMILFTSALVGCGGIFDTAETTTRTFLTRPTVSNTTVNTINDELIISDLYEKIYEDLYEEVLAEVINDISEERFQQIYDSIIFDLLEEIEAGNISVSAASVIDMILAIEAKQANAVVGVRNYNSNGVVTSVGSGVIYKQVGNKYYVLSNNHVVEDGVSFTVVFENGEEVNAVLRGVDELVDVAVLYFISDEEYEVVDFADSDSLRKGEIVLAVGHPSGFNYFGSMTLGIVSGLKRYFDIDEDGVNDMFVGYIQHDAAINSGNSGGALFNLKGELAGVNVIKIAATGIEGMGFAIPANLVEAIVTDIEELGYSIQKPVLGIRFVDIYNNQKFFDDNDIVLPEGLTSGFFIIEVVEDSTMDGYVLPGDIIIEIGDVIITNSNNFVEEFSKYRVGNVIDLVVIRDGVTIVIENIELKAAVR